MAYTSIERAAADVLKKVAPKMQVTGNASNGAEIVSICGINVEGDVPVTSNGVHKYEAPIEHKELRELAQAMRVTCEQIHLGGDRILNISPKIQPEGSYDLVCEADMPGRILTPLKQTLNIDLKANGVGR